MNITEAKDMKRKLKMLLLMLLAAAMVLGTVPALRNVSLAGRNDYKCGENVYWEKDSDNNIRIYGSGDMYDYTTLIDGFITTTNSPFARGNYINNVTIENGVTSIGDNLFNHAMIHGKLTIAPSVTKIGTAAFKNALKVGRNTTNGYAVKFFLNEEAEKTEETEETEEIEETDRDKYILDSNNRRYIYEARYEKDAQGNLIPVYEYAPVLDEDGKLVENDGKTVYENTWEIISLGYKVEADENGHYHYLHNDKGERQLIPEPSDSDKLTRIELSLPNVTYIGEEAFAGAYRLTSVTLGSQLEVIPEKAFEGASLLELRIPVGVKRIESRAFANNGDMYGDLYCGANTEYIGVQAFEKCGDHYYANGYVPQNAAIEKEAFKFVTFDAETCSYNIPV